jgi:hypothetical protein
MNLWGVVVVVAAEGLKDEEGRENGAIYRSAYSFTITRS